MKQLELSVVIPSYDEMANLQKGVLDHVKSYLDKSGYEYEVVIVDDGSTDGSVEFISTFVKENKKFSLIENPHLGKAGAVTTGVISAKGKNILFTDMDQATPIEELKKLYVALESNNFDIAIGSRFTTRKNAPYLRRIISRANIILRKIIVGLPEITDTQCGFKMFKYEAAKNLFKNIKKIHNNFKSIGGSSVSSGFDVELLYIAKKRGYKIKEVPVNWLYVETRRVNPVTDSISGLLELLEIKRNSLKGVYDIV